MLYEAQFKELHEYRITSVGEEEAAKALRRVKFLLEHMPSWAQPRLEVENTTTIKIAETGSWITAIPATRNAGRGDTLNALLCDEAAYQIYSKQIIESASPALEKRGGKLLVVSTMESGTYFSEQYTLSQQGKTSFRPFFFDVWSDPNRTQEWYDSLLEKKGQEYMSKTYPRTWQESLLAVSRMYFDQELLAVDLEREDARHEDGWVDHVGRGQYGFTPGVGGPVRVWRHPIAGRRYVIFADVAEGLEDGDWDNAYVVDVKSAEYVARVRGKMPVGEYADVLCLVGEYYSCGEGSDRVPALLAIEANNHGIAVTEQAAKSGYRNLYMERNLQTHKFTGRIGWLTSQGMSGTRGLMLGALQTEYRNKRVTIWDRTLFEEMSVFAHLGPRGKPQAPPHHHDDCVMSAAGAIAVAMLESAYEQEATKTEYDGEPSDAEYWRIKSERRASGEDMSPGDSVQCGLVEAGG
jgi:hypothetical protein